jgi:large repetitive protein
MRRARVLLLLLVSVAALAIVPTAVALRFTDNSFNVPVGHVGEYYTHTFEGDGGCGPALPYTFTVLSGALPPGLVLGDNGTVAGIPERGGSWSFWLELSDEDPPSADWCTPTTSERRFTITVDAGLAIEQTTLRPIVLGKPYSLQLKAAGGGPQTWSLWAGSPPAGITLSSSGLLAGTPTVRGSSTFIVQVAVGERTASQVLTLSVVQELQIDEVTPPSAEVGLPFTLQLNATGGLGRHTWSLVGDAALPAGLVLDRSTGVISGTPTASGAFPVQLTVTDESGVTATMTVRLVLARKLLITQTRLPAALRGKPYRVRPGASGGIDPRRWTIASGRLPRGVALDTATGVLTGTPRRAGTFRFSLQVRDRLGATATKSFALEVR